MLPESRHVLLVEDNPQDIARLKDLLERSRHHEIRISPVGTLKEALEALKKGSYDAVLLDLSLPDSVGIETVEAVNQVATNIPIIVLTGTEDELVGLQSIHHGAQDVMSKSHADGRIIARMIHFGVERKRFDVEREQLIHDLRQALVKINKMKGLIPICAYCKKIRNDSGFWNQIEDFLKANANVEFSHGICPECQTEEVKKFKKRFGK